MLCPRRAALAMATGFERAFLFPWRKQARDGFFTMPNDLAKPALDFSVPALTLTLATDTSPISPESLIVNSV
jgi:hypothetical protein